MKTFYVRVLCVSILLAASASVAEPDTFGLGTGTSPLTVNAGASPKVINAYARVKQPLTPGDTVISLDNVRTPASTTAFSSENLVMVLQTTGSGPLIPTGVNTAIDLEDYDVGRWEFARLSAATVNSDGTGTLTLSAPLVHGYPKELTQVVRVPEYTTVTVQNNGKITAMDWDGNSGGVVAFLANGLVTVNGSIDVSGQGFRGGQYKAHGTGAAECTTDLSGSSPAHAQKGEGVDLTRYFVQPDQLGREEGAGRGNFANGAGGGVCSSSGGGGGGHGGLGGQGGAANGGMGGAPLLYSLLDRLTFGGGGGSGYGQTSVFLSTPSSGGSAGGIVFIRSAGMMGTGNVLASGNDGKNVAVVSTSGDGGGGAGAGGTIVMRMTGTFDCNNTAPLEAKGGKGGGGNSSGGGGGSGAGGRVLYQAGALQNCPNPIALVEGGAVNTLGGAKGGYGFISSLPGPMPELPNSPVLNTSLPVVDGGYTNQTRPTIQSAASTPAYKGYQVVIYQGSLEVGRTVVDTLGNFSFKMPYLVDGTYSITAAFAHQGVQSLKSPPRTFTVDATAPASPSILLLANRAAVPGMRIGLSDIPSGNMLSVSGMVEPGSVVTVQQTGPGNFNASETATANSLGGWAVNIPQPGSVEQTYTLTARAVDKAGNPSPTQATQLSFDLDTRPPAPPTVSSVGGVALPGARPVNSHRPVVAGTADNGDRVVVTLTRTAPTPVVSQSIATTSVSGAWTVVPPIALEENASYEVTVAAFDAANNSTSAAEPRSFTVDTTAPTLSIGSLGVSGNQKPPVAGMLIGGPDLTGSNLMVSGMVEAQSTVTVRQTGQNLDISPPVTVNGSTWSVSLQQPMNTERAYTLQVTAKDLATNTTAVVLDFNLDTQKPVAPFVISFAGAQPAPGCASSPIHYITTRQPLILGSGEARSTVNVTWSSAPPSPATVVSGSGSWSISPASELSDGTYELSMTATDEAGNESQPSLRHCFTVDATNPLKPTNVALVAPNGEVIDASKPIGRAKLSDVVNNMGTLTIRGNAEQNSRMSLKLIPLSASTPMPGEQKPDVSSGAWSSTWTSLQSGSYALEARVKDAAGNIGDPETIFFTVDLIPPVITISGDPRKGSTSTSKNAYFGFNSNEQIQSYECVIEGSDAYATRGPCPNPLFFSENKETAAYTLKVWAKDLAGNESTLSEWDWKVSTGVPDAFVTAEAGAPPVSGQATKFTEARFKLESTKAGLRLYCSLDQTDAWEVDCGCPTPPPNSTETTVCTRRYLGLKEGLHVLYVKAIAEATQAETPEHLRKKYEWEVDTKKPITLVTLRPGPWVSVKAVKVDYTTRNTETRVSTFTCELNGIKSPCQEGGVVKSDLADGPYTLKIQATDAAGNLEEVPVEVSWNVDTQKPKAPGIQTPEENKHYKTPALAGTAVGEGFGTITVYENGSLLGKDDIDADGTWQLDIPADKRLQEGEHAFQAQVTDRAGNEGALSPLRSFILDNTSPRLSITGPDKNSFSATAEFRFTTDEERVSFKCKLDVGEIVDCTEAPTFTNLEEGPHTLSVYATDEAGNRSELGHSWSIYLGSDRRAEGGGLGCSLASSPPSLPWVLALLGLSLRGASRRRTR